MTEDDIENFFFFFSKYAEVRFNDSDVNCKEIAMSTVCMYQKRLDLVAIDLVYNTYKIVKRGSA